MARRATRPVSDNEGMSTRTMIIGGAIVVGLGLLIMLLVLNVRGPAPISDLVEYNRQDRAHVDQTFELGELPPVGGEHQPVWQNCGIYRDVLEPANVIHSLEHGAVWITYQPELPQAQIDALEDAARGESFVVLSPWPGLKSPVVLTAWQVQLELDSANDRRVDQFIAQYQVGPYTPERGASCTGGLGNPIQ